MKLEIKTVKEISAKYLYIFCGGRLDYQEFTLEINGEKQTFEDLFELLDKYPQLELEASYPGELCFKVDIDTGKVVNLPEGVWMDCYDWKVVDEGTYVVTDEDDNILITYQGYVPNCIGEGDYGDYFEFEIQNSYISEWKFTQEDLDELNEII